MENGKYNCFFRTKRLCDTKCPYIRCILKFCLFQNQYKFEVLVPYNVNATARSTTYKHNNLTLFSRISNVKTDSSSLSRERNLIFDTFDCTGRFSLTLTGSSAVQIFLIYFHPLFRTSANCLGLKNDPLLSFGSLSFFLMQSLFELSCM